MDCFGQLCRSPKYGYLPAAVVKEICPNTCMLCTDSAAAECNDDLNWVDPEAWWADADYSHWEGYDCDVSWSGHSPPYVVKEMCPATCGLCSDTRSVGCSDDLSWQDENT